MLELYLAELDPVNGMSTVLIRINLTILTSDFYSRVPQRMLIFLGGNSKRTSKPSTPSLRFGRLNYNPAQSHTNSYFYVQHMHC